MPALDRLEAGRLKFAPFAECATVFTASGPFLSSRPEERAQPRDQREAIHSALPFSGKSLRR